MKFNVLTFLFLFLFKLYFVFGPHLSNPARCINCLSPEVDRHSLGSDSFYGFAISKNEEDPKSYHSFDRYDDDIIPIMDQSSKIKYSSTKKDKKFGQSTKKKSKLSFRSKLKLKIPETIRESQNSIDLKDTPDYLSEKIEDISLLKNIDPIYEKISYNNNTETQDSDLDVQIPVSESDDEYRPSIWKMPENIKIANRTSTYSAGKSSPLPIFRKKSLSPSYKSLITEEEPFLWLNKDDNASGSSEFKKQTNEHLEERAELSQ